jgi:hypothetical protein
VKAACINAAQNFLGRGLKPQETLGIEDRVRLQMQLRARKDPAAWQAKSMIDRITDAAQAAAKDMIAEKQKAQQRISLTIAAHDRIENFLASRSNAKPGDALRAVSQLLDFDTKRRANEGGFTSAASWAKALQDETFSHLLKTFDSVSPKFFGLFENRAGVRALVKELWGEHSGNAAAKAGADAWRKSMDELRDRYNAAGGDIGKLDEWHYPQHHAQSRIAQAGLNKWLADTLPLLDRRKYIKLDGTRMSDADVQQFLTHAFDSIVTDGMNKQQPGMRQGYGLVADRNAHTRQVFFKDSDSYLKYQGLYGEKSLWSALTDHVRRVARDTALAEVLGPNPDHLFALFNDKTLLAELRAHPEESDKLKRSATFNQELFDYISGRQQVVSQRLADAFQGFRNFETAVKLGKVVITALTDEAGMSATAYANKVPWSAAYMRELRSLDPREQSDRHVAEANALGLNSMLGGLNRFGMEEFGSSWTGKLANWVLHASGAERMWDARRQGLGSVLMSYLGRTTRDVEHFADLNPIDHGVLARKGVTEADWQVWRLAKAEDWGAGARTVLTPKAIHAIPDAQLAPLGDPQALRRHASTQLLAHVLEEAGMGAMDTGARQRVAMNIGTKKGSLGGELWRSAMLFKSFAFSMMTKHWARASSMPTTLGKWGYMSRLIVAGTVMSAIGIQVRNLIYGKDPENMLSPKFWAQAILRGGGLGFYGDFLYDELNEHDNTLIPALGGPLFTAAEDVWNVTGKALFESLKGKRVDEGAKLIRFAKSNIPFLNMWYTQAAMDHILWNSMQDAANPGYLERMQQKAYAQRGTTWYWNPQDRLPSASPDFSKAVQPQPARDEMRAIADTLHMPDGN